MPLELIPYITEVTSAGVRDIPAAIFDTDTGEVVALDKAPTDLLASFVDALRDQKQQIDAAIREITIEACHRADLQNRTQIVGDEWIITVDGAGDKPIYDDDKLAAIVKRLVKQGILSKEAGAEIIVQTWKVDGFALRRAMKRPAVATEVAAAITEYVSKPRRIVKLAKS
jgi:hypothetical protein